MTQTRQTDDHNHTLGRFYDGCPRCQRVRDALRPRAPRIVAEFECWTCDADQVKRYPKSHGPVVLSGHGCRAAGHDVRPVEVKP